MVNNDKIAVSISCITYNHAPYIRECLNGFLMQECDFGFEVLIHDDASTDGTVEIIKEYQRKYPNIIKPIIQEKNLFSQGKRGFHMRYNFSRAKGKYIALCDGDDYWTDKYKLQKQVDFLDNNPEVFLSFHPVRYIDENGNTVADRSCNKLRIYNSKEALHVNMQSLSFVFRKINFPETYFKNIGNGDVVIITCLLNQGNAVDMGFIGGNYRRHVGGIHSSLDFIKQTKNGIFTRRQLVRTGEFKAEIVAGLRREIVRRRIKGMKFAAKRLHLLSMFQILFF